MRCVGSSSAAAASALRNRLLADRLEEQVFDDDSDDADAVDVEPASGLETQGTIKTAIGPAPEFPLEALVKKAEALAGKADPKLNAVVALLKSRRAPTQSCSAASLPSPITLRHACATPSPSSASRP
jgi:hypothetical protein